MPLQSKGRVFIELLLSAELRDEMMNKKLVFIRFNKSGWLAAGGAGAAKMLGWPGRAVQ